MIAQQKILRVFQIISDLSQKPYKSKEQLAKRREVSVKTINRYFQLLEELGYILECDFNGNWFVQVESFPAEKGVNFTIEETELLLAFLRSDTKHPLTDEISRKLFIHSDLRPLSQNLTQVDNAKKIRRLAEAITKGKQVILKAYESANSQTTKDRLVEPLEFSDNYESILTYEPDKKAHRAFKIHRITEVEVTNGDSSFHHTTISEDFFGWVGDKSFTVKLRLSVRASLLMAEGYPATKPYIKSSNKEAAYPYIFEAKVKGNEGVGRFILGLPNETIVESPQSLKDYLNGRIKNLRF